MTVADVAEVGCSFRNWCCIRCCCGGENCDYDDDDVAPVANEFAAMGLLRGNVAIVDCLFCRPDSGWIHQRVAAVVKQEDG